MGTLQLARQVGHVDQPLRAGLQVAQLDLAGLELVADNDREMGSLARRALQLPAELARREIGARRHTRGAQLDGQRQAQVRGRRVGAHDNGHRLADALGGALAGRHHRDAVDPQGEPDAGCRPRPEQLDQPVVTPSPAERRLLTLRAALVELERGARVVVESTHQARRAMNRHLQPVEVGQERVEMVAAGGAQEGIDSRRVVEDGLRPGVSRVEHAKRVGAQAMALCRRQGVLVLGQVIDQRRDERRAACGIADRVEVELNVLYTSFANETQRELDQLGIDCRSRITDRLNIPLVELPVAAGLRAVVAEHRPERRQSNRLRQRVHAVLDERAADARRRLRSERPAILVRAW